MKPVKIKLSVQFNWHHFVRICLIDVNVEACLYALEIRRIKFYLHIKSLDHSISVPVIKKLFTF